MGPVTPEGATKSADRLAGKWALLTGAAHGIGLAIALTFACEGAEVIATDADEDALARLGTVPGVRIRHLDMTDAEEVEQAIREAGGLDVLVNGAGWTHEGDVSQTGEADWARRFDLNVTSMFRMIRTALPGMRARDGGSIIDMGSVQSSIGATKGAVIGLTKSVALDFAGRGVRCDAICPGAIETDAMAARVDSAPDPAAEQAARIAVHPVGPRRSPRSPSS